MNSDEVNMCVIIYFSELKKQITQTQSGVGVQKNRITKKAKTLVSSLVKKKRQESVKSETLTKNNEG